MHDRKFGGKIGLHVQTISYWPACEVGWDNLYQKSEIEQYTVCGKLILPKKWKGI